MKEENEKKNITKSIKISQNQQKVIADRAAKQNMNFSEYVVNCAVHGNNNLTPQMAVKVQMIMNLAMDLVERLDYKEYQTAQQIQKQVQDLNELFHTVTPEQNCYQIEKDVQGIVEGGYDLWESLK